MAVQEERCQCRQKGVPRTILAGWPGSAQLARGTAARRRRAAPPRRFFETRIAFQPPGGGHPLGREAGRFLAWLPAQAAVTLANDRMDPASRQEPAVRIRPSRESGSEPRGPSSETAVQRL